MNDPKILVAMIAALASFLVAILSIISASISSRNSTKLTKDIERLKLDLELEREALKEERRLKATKLEALSGAIKSIQKIKDVIQKIVNSCEKSHHSELAVKNISISTKELVASYEENFTDLLDGGGSVEQKLFHRAKGMAFDIESYVISTLDQQMYTSDLTAEEKKRLRDWRVELSEIQTQLQNSLCMQFINNGTIGVIDQRPESNAK